MKKVMLDESEIPDHWYNILPDLPEPPAPYRHPGTLELLGPLDLPADLLVRLAGRFAPHRLSLPFTDMLMMAPRDERAG